VAVGRAGSAVIDFVAQGLAPHRFDAQLVKPRAPMSPAGLRPRRLSTASATGICIEVRFLVLIAHAEVKPCPYRPAGLDARALGWQCGGRCNEVGATFTDENGWRIGVRTGNLWKRRRVSSAQTIHTTHSQALVEHTVRIGAHGRTARGMTCAIGGFANPLFKCGVGNHVGSRMNFCAKRRSQRLRGGDLSRAPDRP